jgi:HEAT repeat protein
MWSRRRIWFAAMALATVGVIWWLFWGPSNSEPIYKGKRLSYWLQGYSGRLLKKPKWGDTDEAIRQIGTNGIPAMLKMLQAKDSWLKTKLIALVRKQRFMRVNIMDAGDKNSCASLGLLTLGDAASNAVPALIEIYDKNISRLSRHETHFVIGHLGPLAKQAIPSLIRNMTNEDFCVRQDAQDALGRILSEPELVVPAMVAALHDPAPNLVGNAVVILGDYGPDAKAAIPALLELSKTNNAVLKDQTKWALRNIDRETADKAGLR